MSESQLNKKRRLDRQLSTTNDEDDGAREEASKDSLTLLHARNRGLATNLYVYKRKITSLSGALEDASKSKGQLEEAISFFHRRLGHLEADIQAMLSQLSDVYSDVKERQGAAATAGTGSSVDASSSPVHELVKSVIEAGEKASAASLRLTIDGEPAAADAEPAPSSSSSSSSSSSAAPQSAVDAATKARCDFILRATAKLLAAILKPSSSASSSSSSSSSSSAASSMEVDDGASTDPLPSSSTSSALPSFAVVREALSRERAAKAEALLLKDALAANKEALAQAQREISRLDMEARTAKRTLERVAYDHPGLDISEHAKTIAPHGGDFEPDAGGPVVPPQPPALQPLLAASSSSGGSAATPGGVGGFAGGPFSRASSMVFATGDNTSLLAVSTNGGNAVTPAPSALGGVISSDGAGSLAPSSSEHNNGGGIAGGMAIDGTAGNAPQTNWRLPQRLTIDDLSASSSSTSSVAAMPMPLPSTTAAIAGLQTEIAMLKESLREAQEALKEANDSAAKAKAALASAGDDIATLKDEKETMTMLAEDRLKEISEVREALREMTTAFEMLRATVGAPPEATAAVAGAGAGAGGQPSSAFFGLYEASIRGSPFFIAKLQELQGARDVIAGLEAARQEAERQLEASQASARALDARVTELQHMAGSGDVAMRNHVELTLNAFKGALSQEVAAKEAAMKRASEFAAAAEAAVSNKERLDKLVGEFSALHKEYARVRQPWIDTVRAHMASSSSSSASLATADVAQLRAMVAELTAEKEQLTAVVESVSQGYDSASGEVAHLQETVKIREGEVWRLNGLLQRASGEKAQLLTAKQALERQVVELQKGLETAHATAMQQARALEEHKRAAGDERDKAQRLYVDLAREKEKVAALSAPIPPPPGPGAPPPQLPRTMAELLQALGELQRRERLHKEAAASWAASKASEDNKLARELEDLRSQQRSNEKELAKTAKKLEDKSSEAEKLKKALDDAKKELIAAQQQASAAAAAAAAGGSTPMDGPMSLSRVNSSAGFFGSASSSSRGGAGGLSASSSASSTGGGGMEPTARMKEEQLKMLRHFVFCSLCQTNQNNCALKCGHAFCNACVNARLKMRDRKCPTCKEGYTEADVKNVYFA